MVLPLRKSTTAPFPPPSALLRNFKVFDPQKLSISSRKRSQHLLQLHHPGPNIPSPSPALDLSVPISNTTPTSPAPTRSIPSQVYPFSSHSPLQTKAFNFPGLNLTDLLFTVGAASPLLVAHSPLLVAHSSTFSLSQRLKAGGPCKFVGFLFMC